MLWQTCNKNTTKIIKTLENCRFCAAFAELTGGFTIPLKECLTLCLGIVLRDAVLEEVTKSCIEAWLLTRDDAAEAHGSFCQG